MKMIILLAMALMPTMIFGQLVTSGTVKYVEKVNMHMNLGPEMDEFKAMIPEFQESGMELIFNENESIYRDAENAESSEGGMNWQGSTEDGHQMKMQIDKPKSSQYKNLTDGVYLESREFMGKKFLINGELKKLEWKMLGEQKVIANDRCLLAEAKDGEDVIQAYFSSIVKVSNGPGSYTGLPGMIMEVNINNGQRIITAVEVISGKVASPEIEKPSKGKKVTSEEFEKIMDEKTKEMGGDRKGGMIKVIRTERG